MKLASNFNDWINKAVMPIYLTTAKEVLLPKSESPLPEYGNLRSIAITPSVSRHTKRFPEKESNKTLTEPSTCTRHKEVFSRALGH